jgi:hypothetical protein
VRCPPLIKLFFLHKIIETKGQKLSRLFFIPKKLKLYIYIYIYNSKKILKNVFSSVLVATLPIVFVDLFWSSLSIHPSIHPFIQPIFFARRRKMEFIRDFPKLLDLPHFVASQGEVGG